MKLRVVLSLLLCAAAASVSAQSSDAPRAGERFKSVRVLAEIPASQIIPTMAFISNSLGVTCLHCHTDVYESDEKPAKQKAREMIQMMRVINERAFGGALVVTCQTCHNGRVTPSSMPPIENAGWNKPPVAAASLPLPDASGTVERYLKAVGTSQFEKLANQLATGTVTRNNGRTAPVSDVFELYQGKPRTLRLSTTLSHPPEADVELSMVFLKPVLLKDAYTAFTVKRRDRIGDRAVIVLSAESRRGGVHTLYFDDDSGLLIRRTDEIETPLGRVPQQYDFERYRTVDGFAVPGIIRWSRADYQVTFELTDIHHNVAPPAAGK